MAANAGSLTEAPPPPLRSSQRQPGLRPHPARRESESHQPKVCSAAAAAAKSLQSSPTVCDPMDSTHQAPPSTGFSRQEYWSGLPFASPPDCGNDVRQKVNSRNFLI